MTGTLLLWVLILHASLQLSESHGHDFEEVKAYEVVRPVRLHSVRKRHTEHLRPETVKYAMTVGGRDIEMQLERNRELLTKDYTETYYHADGTRVTTAPDDVDHCYYHGSIGNDSQSSVSVSTCDGLRGYFRTSAQRYLIEPLSGGDEGDHAVTTIGDKESTPAMCGVTNTSWSDDFEPPTSRSRSRSAGISIIQKQKYIELFLVADNRLEVILSVYKPLRTFIALVGLEIWSGQDMIPVTPPAGANLDAFMKWRNSVLVKRKKHDNAHLISGIDFEGATVGLAYIATLCTGQSVGVVQDHNDLSIAVGATLAHEMGHNLGMNHDDSSTCACSGDSCIMAAPLSSTIPQTFFSHNQSNKQIVMMRTTEMEKNRTTAEGAVMDRGPKHSLTGCMSPLQECTNPCCNATACTLKEGSQCAEGECCEDCKVLPRSTECRRSRDGCDLAEYCDGESATCPENIFAVNGLPCDGDLGYCYNGQCPQRLDQCVKMYGASAIEARSFCYQQNTRGTYYAFCRRPQNDKHIPCQREDVLCGKLFCHGGTDSPNYGRMVRLNDCKAAFFDDYTKDYGQVDTGTKCGDGKVCSQNECVELETAYRNINCSAKCPGHAVCNHRSECQCEPGWMPPHCDANALNDMSSGKTGSSCSQRRRRKPKGAPPPPPPAGNRPKPPVQNYITTRQVSGRTRPSTSRIRLAPTGKPCVSASIRATGKGPVKVIRFVVLLSRKSDQTPVHRCTCDEYERTKTWASNTECRSSVSLMSLPVWKTLGSIICSDSLRLLI
uniref:ADAM metallopeptidase domain 28 n=1 Tax=Cyclopterus lumpus TaxID=8103 RepID=A0A8C2YZF8_CYCLU